MATGAPAASDSHLNADEQQEKIRSKVEKKYQTYFKVTNYIYSPIRHEKLVIFQQNERIKRTWKALKKKRNLDFWNQINHIYNQIGLNETVACIWPLGSIYGLLCYEQGCVRNSNHLA